MNDYVWFNLDIHFAHLSKLPFSFSLVSHYGRWFYCKYTHIFNHNTSVTHRFAPKIHPKHCDHVNVILLHFITIFSYLGDSNSSIIAMWTVYKWLSCNLYHRIFSLKYYLFCSYKNICIYTLNTYCRFLQLVRIWCWDFLPSFWQ